MWAYTYSDELYHHGIKGQKWGIRRFQNKDGSRTLLGKKRRQETEDLSKYSDDELIRKTNRNRVETNYYNSVNDKRRASSGGQSQRKKMPEWISKPMAAVLTTASSMLVADLIKNGESSILVKAGKGVTNKINMHKAVLKG